MVDDNNDPFVKHGWKMKYVGYTTIPPNTAHSSVTIRIPHHIKTVISTEAKRRGVTPNEYLAAITMEHAEHLARMDDE